MDLASAKFLAKISRVIKEIVKYLKLEYANKYQSRVK